MKRKERTVQCTMNYRIELDVTVYTRYRCIAVYTALVPLMYSMSVYYTFMFFSSNAQTTDDGPNHLNMVVCSPAA